MQRHKFRSETLLVVEGELTVSTLQAYNESLLLKRLSKGNVFRVLPNQWHSYGNPEPEPCVLIETWIGSKMSEEDIERYSLNNSLLKG